MEKCHPYVGATVHYKPYDDQPCQAAIITRVLPSLDGEEDLIKVSMMVFAPGEGCGEEMLGEHSQDKHFAGTWHWPEGISEDSE